jgi:threonine dehydratase
MPSPITFDDILAARERLRPHLDPTPLRSYPLLDAAVGNGVRVLVKHENLQPTGAFKIRNGLNAVLSLDPAARARGVVGASTGNHGQGLARAGQLTGVSVTICVPLGNNPDKNEAIRAFGATLVEEGEDYAAATLVADRIRTAEGRTLIHSTENAAVLAGAGTLGLEILEQAPEVDTLVVAIGGGSQAVGAITAAGGLGRPLTVFGAQAAGASAARDSWHARRRLVAERVNTFAEGVATRTTYDLTFDALLWGLADFATVTDSEIADAMRLALRTTHTLVEPAGAVGLAALRKLAPALRGRPVAIIFSGANVDEATLKRVISGDLSRSA